MNVHHDAAGQVRFAWARLNADSLFLGLLLLAAGTFAFLVPVPQDEVIAARQAAGDVRDVYPLFYVLAGSYALAGLLLVGALVKGSVRVEVIARSILIGGTALNVYRHVVWLGWSETTMYQTVVFAIIASTSVLRMSLLLGRSGMLISRPAASEEDR